MPSPKKYRKPYDWDKIREDWLTCEFNLPMEFCKARGIPIATAKRYLKKKEREAVRAEAVRAGRDDPAELINAQTGAEVVERKRVYISSLEQATEAVNKVRDRALTEFDSMTKKGAGKLGWRSPAEAGNLVLRAATDSTALSGELQGIPPEDDQEAWDLTKGFWPQRYQRDFLFDTPSSLRREGREGFIFAFVGGLGSGKTITSTRKFGWVAWQNRGLPCAIYAPTYRMLEDPSCAKHRFLETIQEVGLSYRYHATQNKITLFGDTDVLFRSMDDPEHLRGPELAAVLIDEGLQMSNRKAFDVIIGRVRGRVGDPNKIEAKEPCVLFAGTPNGLNWGYDLLVEEAEANRVCLYHGRTQDNMMIDPGYHQRLSRIYDERFAKQELDGEFIDVHRGRIHFPFGRAIHVIQKSIKQMLRPELPLDLSVDFNVNPMAWNISQDIRHNGDMITYVLDEIHINDTDTTQAIAEFVRRYGGHTGGIRVFGDATGRARKTSATRTDYKIITDTLEAKKVRNVSIKVGRSNPRQTDGINSVNGRLMSATGEVHLYFLAGCKETIKDFERTAFKPGTREIDKSTGASHHVDNIRYKIDRLYPVRKISVHQHGSRPSRAA